MAGKDRYNRISDVDSCSPGSPQYKIKEALFQMSKEDRQDSVKNDVRTTSWSLKT